MNDKSHLDYSTEGTTPVFDLHSDEVVKSSEQIFLLAPGPGPARPSVSGRMKFILGLFSVVVLLLGLGTGIFLVKQRQNPQSKAFSPGNCRCSGTSWICENEQGGHDYMGERPGCGSGTPPESVETKITDLNTGITTTLKQVTTFTDTAGNKTVQTFTNSDTSNPNTTGGTNINNTGGVVVTSGGGSVVINRNLDVPITSLCEIKTCIKREEWENGANAIKNCGSNCHSLIESELRAQNKLKGYVPGTNILDYLSSGKVSLNTIYTDAVKDLDGNSTNGIQIAELRRTCTGASNCTYEYGSVKTVTLNSDPNCEPGNNTCLTEIMSTRDEPNATVTTDATGKIVIRGLNPQPGTSEGGNEGPPTGGPPTGGGGGNPPTTTTTSQPSPVPSTPPTPQSACYQLQIIRSGSVIQPWQINQGDVLIFRGFASVSGGATVSKMRFVVTVGGIAQAPVDVNAALVGGLYQADYNYTISQSTSYSVTTSPLP